jgi:nicotinic acid phosphoribosyltransferase
MNNAYPKTFTHRDDHLSAVVVMNAEQESQLPAEFLPAVVVGGLTGSSVMAASDLAADVMLTPEYAAMLTDRETLERDRTAFAEYEALTRSQLAADADKLAQDRANLVAGYTADKNKLDADRIALDQERAAFEAAKAGAAPDPAAATSDTTNGGDPAADATDTAAAGPAKRVRVAKTADEV